jgi:hypothetical protein
MSDRRVSAILGALMVLLVAGLVDNVLLTAIGTAMLLIGIAGFAVAVCDRAPAPAPAFATRES